MKRLRKISRKQWLILVILFAVKALLFWSFLPDRLFEKPTSTVLEDRNGKLLSARIADDGQWRFPALDSVPEKFSTSLIHFEDRHFKHHPGIDPTSIGRAVLQNLKKKKVVSGASTITMQVSRMSRGKKSRGLWQKIIESILALRIECSFSKDEIINIWASNAPMGGNVVGLEAASWRYYECSPEQLSWAEAATLAVLPNAPSLIYPGKNSEKLLAKRNRLLTKLCKYGQIDSTTLILALQEPLPGAPARLPDLTPHLIQRAISEGMKGQRISTTIDRDLQVQVNQKLNRHQQKWAENKVNNAAALVLDVNTGEVLAYVGNAANAASAKDVDIITSRRSSGSILKPFLYADMLQHGEILTSTLVPDVPSDFAGYQPKNFSRGYDGAVNVDVALTRSLNIPAVHMLQQHGMERFHTTLNKAGIREIDRHPDHYGLSLVLGGAECSLWTVTSAYANLSRSAKGQDRLMDFKFDQFGSGVSGAHAIDQGAAFLTLQTLRGVNRPASEGSHQQFESHRPFAWKTGTSFGMRDAWAVGVDQNFAIGIWVGNATGEGRPALTGIRAAAPLLFNVLRDLPNSGWFENPDHLLEKVLICDKTGYLAGSDCETAVASSQHANGSRVGFCPYHRSITTNMEGSKLVNSTCYPLNLIKQRSAFILPPLMAWYYGKKHPEYEGLPRESDDCEHSGSNLPMALVYPRSKAQILIPKNLDGSKSKAVFEATHSEISTQLHWHLDDLFLGSTKGNHRMEIEAAAGEHLVTLVDEQGNKLNQWFEVLASD